MWLLQASNWCGARGHDQIVEHSLDNEKVLDSSQQSAGWALNFRVRMLLKGTIKARSLTQIMTLYQEN